MSDAPLQRKLRTITIASAGSALFLACTAFVAYELVSFRATMARSLSIQAQILARQSASAVVFKYPEVATVTLSALGVDPHVVAAGIYTPDGTIFASYLRDGEAPGYAPGPPGPQVPDHVFESGRLLAYRTIEFDGAPIGTVVIESDLQELRTWLQRFAVIVLTVLLASFVVAHYIASRLQRAITGPVLHLAQTAQAVSSGQDYSVRAVVQGHGELALLIRTFNHMLEQIQERDAALQRARDDLELEVDQRTEDLKKEIADRKRLEEELRGKNKALEEQSWRLQEATRLKSEFLANMSHELRTPLNAIIGFAELLFDGKVGPVSATQKECLDDVLTSSRHLLQLINDVLDLSKVEAGKMEFRPEAVDVAKLVVEVRDILRGLTARKRIEVETDLQEGLGGVVTDPGKLKQVLYNYLSNALKFTPDGGRIALRARAEGPEHFRVEVEDNGVGIQPEDMARLFVEFQQLDASAAKAHPGTGLGLALTKRIVEAQGGQVGVRSTPGKGSLFFAVLPRVTPGGEGPAAVPPVGPAEPGASTVLVIEDDGKERAWLVETLSAAAYAVEVARTGQEALARCRERVFDGITLDLLLSDMTGWDVLRELRSGGRNAMTPVIVVSVVAEKGAAAAFPVQDYLVKPVTAERLLAALERAGVRPQGRPILVVDDDPQARRLLETTLQTLGYRTLSAATGAEALRVAETHPPAAVILDLLMPEMDGFAFLDRFRPSPMGHAPVIVWTAKDLTREDYARLAASAQAVVLKREGGASSLVDRLRAHLESRKTAGVTTDPPHRGEPGSYEVGASDPPPLGSEKRHNGR